MAKLEVQIGADNSDLKLKIAEAERDLSELSKIKLEKIKLGLDTKEIDANIKDVKKSINDLKQVNNDLGKSFDKNTPKIANGGNTLMQFSRIAQDAPFGIMGIGNNITATAESFGYLSKQAGGAGNALKAIGSSLLGTGGILLGVSLLTTGLTLLSQSGLTLTDVFNKLTGNVDEIADSLKKAYDEAAKSALEESSGIKGLISVAQSETLSRKERTAAIDELQKKYPAYFGNLSHEQIMYGNLTGTVNELTKALINKQIAEQVSKDAVEPTRKLWQANARLVQEKKKLNEIEAKYPGKDIIFAPTKEIKAQIQSTREEIISLTAVVDSYQKVINNASQASAKLLIQAPKATKTGTVKAPNVTPQVSGLNSPLQAQGLEDTSGKVMQIAKGVQGAEGVISTSMMNIKTAFDSNLLESLQMMKDFNDEMNNLVTGSLTDTFNNLGNAIGEALASGTSVLGAIGTTLLQSMGKFLSDMGGMLIKYGTLAVVKGKLDLAIATGGPLSIGAGLAAIAVGVALKAAGAAIGGAATKGSSGGGSSRSLNTGSSYSSPSSNISSSSVSSGGTVVFEIDGQKLVGVLSNTLNKNSRLGGKLSIG